MTDEAFTKGKKKEAVSRVQITETEPEKASVKINKKPVDIHKPEMAKEMMKEPINIAKEILGEEEVEKLKIKANTQGGGKIGQAIATRTAIGKALVKWSGSEQLKEKYMDYDRSLLVDDYRRKESKKPLRKGARARPTKSYR